MKIFLVDDEKIISKAIQRLLEKNQHEVTVFNSGSEALEYLTTNKNNSFDIFFIDYLMPEVSGSDILASARTKFPQAKIYMMTAFSDNTVREQFMSLGANAVLKKPFDDIHDLLKLVV
ncbi:MAG: response regulator [Oligoflexia bacterium]|nr:response regulator [Oligoflexia bacterium]